MKIIFISILLSLTITAFAQEYGEASYYSDKLHGRNTASGEPYNKNEMTAAHKTHPFGTMLRVTHLDNNRSVVVRVNDRGPFKPGRVVDVSRKAAEQLDLVRAGVARVRVELVSDGETMTSRGTNTTRNNKDSRTTRTPAPSTYNDNSVPKKVTSKTPIQTTRTASTNTDKANAVRSNFNKYGLYKIQLLQPERRGYGVQIASYSSYDNAMQQVTILQGKWFDEILVNVEPGKSNMPTYKVILGQFDSKSAAETYKKNLKQKHRINGFVVDLSKP